MKQLVLDISPPPQPSLDNFVVGPNAEVMAHLRAWQAGNGERFIYLWGPPGSGKTHLLRSLAQSLPSEEIAVVDDVAQLDTPAQQELFNKINMMRNGIGCMLVAGPCAPLQLQMRDDLRTRLGQFLVLQLHGLSDEDKIQALMAHAQQRGFALSYDIAAYLLKHWPRDIRALLAVLDALDQYSLQVKRPVTLPLVREVVGQLQAAG